MSHILLEWFSMTSRYFILNSDRGMNLFLGHPNTRNGSVFFFFFLEEISSRFYCQLHPSVIVFHYASNDLPITYLESPILFGLLSHFGGRNLLESSREDFLLLLQLILAWKTRLQCCY